MIGEDDGGRAITAERGAPREEIQGFPRISSNNLRALQAGREMEVPHRKRRLSNGSPPPLAPRRGGRGAAGLAGADRRHALPARARRGYLVRAGRFRHVRPGAGGLPSPGDYDEVYPRWLRYNGRLYGATPFSRPVGSNADGAYALTGYHLNNLQIYTITNTPDGQAGRAVLMKLSAAPTGVVFEALVGCS